MNYQNKKILLILLLLFVMVIVFSSYFNRNDKHDITHEIKIDLANLDQLAIDEKHKRLLKNNKKIFFIVDFKDFNCSLCLHDFLNLSDTISSKNYEISDYAVCFLEPDGRNQQSFERMILRWKEANNLKYDVFLIEDLKEKLNLEKSCILIKKNYYFEGDYFPLGKSKFFEMIDEFSKL